MGNTSSKGGEISCGQAQDKLKIVFVDNDNLGQRIYLEGINDRTTMDFVANYVMNSLKAKAMDISFVSEYSKAMKLYTNKKKVTGDGVKSSVEAVSGFLTTGVTCSVDQLVAAGCVRIRIDKREQFVDIPYRSKDTVLDLKKKILDSSQIPTENQLMKFEDKTLTNNLKMTQIGIEQYDEVWIHTYPRFLSILMPNGEKVRLAVQNQDTFGEVCSQACKEAQIDSDGVTLLYNNSSIEQNTLMGELDIDLENDNQFTAQKDEILSTKKDDQTQSKKAVMTIYVKTNTQKKFKLEVDIKDTIERVKQKIQVVERIHPDQQRLSFNGSQLEDEQTLEDCNIQTGSTIELWKETTQITQRRQTSGSQNRNAIQVFVRLMSGKTVTLNVSLNESIKSLKQKIQLKENCSLHQYKLEFNGRQLEDGRRLQDYDIQQQATLDLERRLLGGMPPKLFVNMDEHNDMTKLNWADNGPRWRAAASGLSVEGRCNNESCIANGKLVIYIAGYCDFDMLK
ncbi:MAG: putative ubiquitin C, partial [Streblomastix strix]